MKKIKNYITKSTAAALAILAFGMNTQAADMAYSDVYQEGWYYSSVMYVAENQIMTGLQDTYFGVEEELARAQFTVILYRMAGSPEVAYDFRFRDVPEGEWYTDAVLWANNAGVVTGYTDTQTFGASDPITREQIAAMMYRYASYIGSDTEGRAVLDTYPDAADVSTYAIDAMQWAVSEGIITGDGGYLLPQHNTSRAVCATIITRFLKADVEQIPDAEDKVYYPEQKIDGQQVVDFARQYVGKLPYVYGGISLVTGADCSGFVQSVYKQFGVYLGRATYSQEQNGFEIPLSEAKPGDLVFYGNVDHVAIYSGDNKVIHALNPSAGTVETDIYYTGTVKMVRRVL